jgi:hypothetical protein
MKKNGRIHKVNLPEYHIDCGGGCGMHLTLTATGLTDKKSEAESLLKSGQTEDDSTGWHKSNGLWYCPDCPGKVDE